MAEADCNPLRRREGAQESGRKSSLISGLMSFVEFPTGRNLRLQHSLAAHDLKAVYTGPVLHTVTLSCSHPWHEMGGMWTDHATDWTPLHCRAASSSQRWYRLWPRTIDDLLVSESRAGADARCSRHGRITAAPQIIISLRCAADVAIDAASCGAIVRSAQASLVATRGEQRWVPSLRAQMGSVDAAVSSPTRHANASDMMKRKSKSPSTS